MKVSANQAILNNAANNALPSLDPLKAKGVNAQEDIEEKFLDLLAQLFQGANLQSHVASLNQQIPNVKVASTPVRDDKSDDLLDKRPLREMPKSDYPEKSDNSVNVNVADKQAETAKKPVVKDSDSSAQNAEVVENDQTQSPEVHEVQKCGNSRGESAAQPSSPVTPATAAKQAEVTAAPAAATTADQSVENAMQTAQAAAPEATAAAQPVMQQEIPEASKEMSDIVKKILADVRKALMSKESDESAVVDPLAVDKEILQPLNLLKSLFDGVKPNAETSQQSQVNLAELMTKLKQMDLPLGNSQELLKRLSGLSNKGLIDGAIGPLSNNIEKLLSRPAKQSPMAELASKRAMDIVDKVKEAIEKAVKSRDGSTLTLNLNPKDLGEVVVRVQQREDQIFAKISPKVPEVQEIIKAKIDEVVKVLMGAGFKQDHIHISVGGGFELSDNGSRFATYEGGGEQSSSSKRSKGEQVQEEVPGGALMGESKASNSSGLSGWVA